MHLKIGLAAAVFAAVGTFAVAEGAGEGGCGDNDCKVGTVLNFSAYELYVQGIPLAGHTENASVQERYYIYTDYSGISNTRSTGGNSGTYTGLSTSEGVYDVSEYDYFDKLSVGNCSVAAGESSTSGVGGGTDGSGCN